MKTILKSILLICILLFSINKIKAQGSCVSAVTLTHPFNQTVNSYTASAYWFTTTLSAGAFDITVTTKAGSTGKFTKADVYATDCSTFLYTDTLISSSDTVFTINISDTTSRTYYIKLTNVGGTSNLNVKSSSVTTLVAVGDIGYCAGQQVQIAAFPINASGTKTYTWTTSGSTGVSGVNTATVTATPTVSPTTYTLTYHDSNGTITYTVSIFALPASMCNSCEMVKNGAFEATQWDHRMTTDVLLSSSSCTQYTYSAPMSDPKYWKAATCGTPDYFSSLFLNIYNGAPTNMLATNTSAHNGNGYGGFYNSDNAGYGGTLNNYREYLQGPLKCALVTGQLYNVSFYLSLANKQSSSVSSDVGAYFSTSTYTSTTLNNLNVTPQITSSGISGVGSWTQVKGTLTGGGEQYITLGNFKDDLNTTPFPSNTSSYYFVDDISVTPATPTLTAGSCISGSVTITAYGVPNNTITTWAGPSSYTASGSSITVTSPTAAATYTCTVNLSNGCSYCTNITQTITINPVTSCSASASPATSPTVTPYTFSSSPGYSSSNITVNNGINYIITSTDLRMAAGTSITVKNGGTLTIQGAWIHGCNECTSTNMWQGIIVENGGTVVMTTRNILFTFYGNIIEDAIQAVSTATSTATTPIPSWSISSTIFNNCSTGVYVGSHVGDLSGNTIDNSVFTCRKLGSHSVNLTNITAIRNNILATTPILVSSSNPVDYTIAGARSKYGIYLNSVGSLTTAVNVGSSSSSANIFDNLDYGIYDISTSLTAKNNVFRNLTGNSYNYPSSLPTGVGIFGDASASCQFGACAVDAVLIVGNNNTTIDNTEKNSFTNCLGGILLNKFRQVYINNNTFDNETTATTFTASGSLVTGQNAVTNLNYGFTSIGGGSIEKMQFANNNVKNYSYGYFLDFYTPTNTNAGASSGSGYIYNNTISATGSNYCNYGLYLQQSSATTPSVSIPQNAIDITANTISNMTKNAISVNSVNTSSATTGFIQIHENTELSVKYKTGAALADNISAIRINSSYRTKINDNTSLKVTGFTGTYPSTNAQYLGGVYMYASPSSTVVCNTPTQIGEGFIWEGASASSVWKNNTMANSRYGLTLRNSGVMGDQGSSGSPIYDVFNNSTISSYQTLCDASNPGAGTMSRLYTQAPTCTTTSTYQPCTNGQVAGTAYTASGGTVTLLSASGNSTYTCVAGGGGGGGRMAGSATTGGVVINDQKDSLRAELDSMIMSNIPYASYDYETHWAMQYYVNSVDTGVHVMQGYDNAKRFALVDGQLALGNYAQAQNLNNSIIPSGTIENNWKTVNSLAIGNAPGTNYVFSQNDITALRGIAAQCPLTGGSIVYRARTMLNNYYGTILEYPDVCPINAGNDGGGVQRNTGINEHKAPNQFVLYPNPNRGDMTLEYKITQNATLEITDISGKLVGKYNLPADSFKIQITNERMENGIYLYRVLANSSILKAGKIIVMK